MFQGLFSSPSYFKSGVRQTVKIWDVGVHPCFCFLFFPEDRV